MDESDGSFHERVTLRTPAEAERPVGAAGGFGFGAGADGLAETNQGGPEAGAPTLGPPELTARRW